VPLGGLPGVAEAGIGLSGTVSAELHIAGTQNRPEISGTVKLGAVNARGIRLGNGTIELTPGDVGNAGAPPVLAVAAKGTLFDRFTVDGRFAQSFAASARGPTVHGTVEFTHLALEALLPELTTLGDGRGLASGRVSVDIEPGRPLAADVLLSELWVSLARAIEAAPGEATTRRVEIRASKAVHVSVAGDHVSLDSLNLSTTGGNLRAQGALAGTKVDGIVEGHVDLELLQPFLRGLVDRVSGDLDVGLVASGSLDKPILRGTLNVRDPIRFRPKTFESDVVIPSGEIALEPGVASVRKLGVTVDGSTTQLDGRLLLGPDFRPQSIDAHLAGEISARMLSYLAGEAISEAQGRARINADVRGTLTDPTVTAWLAWSS
jgi:autotransporter translocation and assembly factor TamB